MRGKIKTARRQASELHGATATFVSLVDAGANETPFQLLKSAKGANTMAIKKRSTPNGRLKKSHKKLTTDKKNTEDKDVVIENRIAKMVFSSEHFEDEAAVQAYLDEAEWEAEDTTITKNDDGDWEVRGDGLTDDDFVRTQKVEADDDGVTAFVGQIEVSKSEAEDEETDEDEDEDDGEEAELETKSDDEEDEEDEEGDEEEVTTEEKGKKKPYKKAAPKTPAKKLSKRAEFIAARKAEKEKVSKFDPWDARYSKGNTVAKALSDGMAWDQTPPGYYDVQAAFNSAVANIVSGEGMPQEDKQEALNKAAADYAEIIGSLDSYFDDFIGMDEETLQKHVKSEDDREALAKWAGEYGDFIAGETEAPAKLEKSVKSGEAAEFDYSKITDDVQSLISKALEPVLGQVGEISDTVQSIATRAPTKKAAEPDDGDAAGPRTVKTKKDDADDRTANRKSLMDRAVFG